MDLTQLQYFRCIAEEENLTRAAERLYVAQPNLSVSISRLEAELGVSLFDRRRGRIRLTATGRLFLKHVERVLGELNEGIAAVRTLEQRTDEQLRVASCIVDLMGMLIREVLRGNPDLSFFQLYCRNEDVPRRVLDGEVDIGFLFGDCPLPGLEYREIDRCERVLQLAADHPLAGRSSVSLSELNGEKFICSLARDDRSLYEELAKNTNFRPDIYFECDDIRVEYSMTLCGGVMITPIQNHLKMVKNGMEGITCLRLREHVPPCRLGMIRHRGSRLSGACLDFYTLVDCFFRKEREEYNAMAANNFADIWPPEE